MTRETKIGLLVGLAFIIVIGILLEDHFSAMSEPHPATLSVAGENARQGAGQPQSSRESTPPGSVNPTHTVQTNHDLEHQHINEIKLEEGNDRPRGNGADNTPPARVNVNDGNNSRIKPPAGRDTTPPTVDDRPPVADANGDRDARTLEMIRRAHALGEDVVIIHPDGTRETIRAPRPDGNGQTDTPPVKPHPPVTDTPQGREVVAEANDNLSKLALKYLGANSKANRELIIRANPDLAANPDRIIVGHTYIIPGAKPDASARSGGAPDRAPDRSADRTPRDPQPPAPGPTDIIYVVKPNDNLWRIANEQCGTPAAQTAIKELNKEVLKGSDQLQVGMKLKLPARVASTAS